MKEKLGVNLIDQRLANLRTAPRCKAMAKSTRMRCEAPAVKGWKVCRCHGARGGAPKGMGNGAYRTGRWTEEMKAERRKLADLVKDCREYAKWLAKQL